MTPLRERMTNDLQLRNRSPRTIKTYVAQVAAFACHFGRSPADLGPEEIRQYQLYLIKEKHVGWSTFNQCTCALRFLYGTTLDRSKTTPASVLAGVVNWQRWMNPGAAFDGVLRPIRRRQCVVVHIVEACGQGPVARPYHTPSWRSITECRGGYCFQSQPVPRSSEVD